MSQGAITVIIAAAVFQIQFIAFWMKLERRLTALETTMNFHLQSKHATQ